MKTAFQVAREIAAVLTSHVAEAHPDGEANEPAYAVLRSTDPTLPSLAIEYDLANGAARLDHYIRFTHDVLKVKRERWTETRLGNSVLRKEFRLKDSWTPAQIAKKLMGKALPEILKAHQADLKWLEGINASAAKRATLEQELFPLGNWKKQLGGSEHYIESEESTAIIRNNGTLEVSTNNPDVIRALLDAGLKFRVGLAFEGVDTAVKVIKAIV